MLKGEFVEGSFKSHQVPLQEAGKDDEQFNLLREWLESYQIHELIDVETGAVSKDVLSVRALLGCMTVIYLTATIDDSGEEGEASWDAV
jgi:hypothetical protein